MTHSSWPPCAKVRYEKRSSLFHVKQLKVAPSRTHLGPETHMLSTCAAHTGVEMSGYRYPNMSSLIEMHNKHRLPFPLIKSGTSEKWVLCDGRKITPITTSHTVHMREDVEDTLAVHQLRAVAHEATQGDS